MAIKYYVRKSWEDTATQQGAYNVLSNAVAVCDGDGSGDTGYRVYDAEGNLVYNPWYYVRPSWADADKQSGAYRVYSNATTDADKRGYNVYDYLGVPRYPTPYLVQLTAATPYYEAADGAAVAGTAAKGIYTITAIKSPYGQLKSGAGWLDLRGMDVYATDSTTTSPLTLAAENVADVYGCAIGCKHVSGSYSWATAMSKKQVNCAIMASRVAYLAGLVALDKLISHRDAVKTNIVSQKGTISKAMSGYSNLDLDKCSVKWVGKTYSNLASKYRVPGAIYVYDSNIAVCAGNGVIYSCNNGSSQLSNGVYAKNAMTSGYCFTSPVLVVILPNS